MNDFFINSATIGVVISLISYAIGVYIKQKLKSPIFNPLLISIILVIGFLYFSKINYEEFNSSAKYLSYLLAPATVSLAIPLYEKLDILKQNAKAISVAMITGVISSLASILVFAFLFNLSSSQYATILPKSVTTAIGMEIAIEMGGVGPISAAIIIITGVWGNIVAEIVCKVFRINHPVSRGLAIGASSHAVGTVKAIEMGEIEGAISSLAIVICGVLTIVFAPIFVNLI